MDPTAADAETLAANAERFLRRIHEFAQLVPEDVCRRLVRAATEAGDALVVTAEDDVVLFPPESVAKLPAPVRWLLRSVVGKKISELPPPSAWARRRQMREDVTSARYYVAHTWVSALEGAAGKTSTRQLDEKLRPQGEYLSHPPGGFADHLHHSLAMWLPEEAADELFDAFAAVVVAQVDLAIAERGEFEVAVMGAGERLTIVRDADGYCAKTTRPVRSAG